jgi:hypothetical protein
MLDEVLPLGGGLREGKGAVSTESRALENYPLWSKNWDGQKNRGRASVSKRLSWAMDKRVDVSAATA